MILEGNTNWTAGTYQSLTGEPLGLTKFGDILATQMSRKGISKNPVMLNPGLSEIDNETIVDALN